MNPFAGLLPGLGGNSKTPNFGGSSKMPSLHVQGLASPHAMPLRVPGMGLGALMKVKAAREALKQLSLGKGHDMDTALWSKEPATAPKASLGS